MDVSIIIPIHNASKWLDECFDSVLKQKCMGKIEISIFNDSSTIMTVVLKRKLPVCIHWKPKERWVKTIKICFDSYHSALLSFHFHQEKDDSLLLCQKWKSLFENSGFNVVLNSHYENKPKGVGFAKNRAVYQSHGEYLCFLDADDVMEPNRIQKQWEMAKQHPNAIIGSKFSRNPKESTLRFTNWANNLSPQQLYTQIYTSHGPTLIMPTWFCHKNVFLQVGGFNEDGKGIPEDLIFFFAHLDKSGELYRVNEHLLIYRYHIEGATFSVSENTIWDIRIANLEKNVLNSWSSFTIWNAGKQGRRFYRSLSDKSRAKVVAFCDVDEKKIAKGIYVYENSLSSPKPTVPIIHFTDAKPPFIICVKLDLTQGNFEKNIDSLNLEEGIDYFHFN